jgi:hypothetical protein
MQSPLRATTRIQRIAVPSASKSVLQSSRRSPVSSKKDSWQCMSVRPWAWQNDAMLCQAQASVCGPRHTAENKSCAAPLTSGRLPRYLIAKVRKSDFRRGMAAVWVGFARYSLPQASDGIADRPDVSLWVFAVGWASVASSSRAIQRP